MQELLLNKDFLEYRELEIEAGAEVLNKLIEGHVGTERFIGAMDMLKKILRIPEDQAKGESSIKLAKELSEKSFNIFERRMVKRILSGEDRD
jgi:hypothetical protein